MLLKATFIAVVIVAGTGAVYGQRRIIPVCPTASDAERLVGFEIKLLIPKETTVEQGHNGDYVYWRINFGQDKGHFRLSGFSGLQAFSGEPSRENIKASRKFIRRYWVHNKQRGVDARGTFKNGKLWRNFGMFGDVVSYYNVSADAAAYFDRLITTACFIN